MRTHRSPPRAASRCLQIAIVLVVAFAIIPKANATLRPLSAHRYQKGQNVRDVQWLLGGHAPSIYKINAFRYPVNGTYGVRTKNAVKNMKWRLGYKTSAINGNVAGEQFTAYLRGARRPFSYRLEAGKRAVALAKAAYDLAHPPVSAKIKLLISDAQYLINHRYQIGYSQSYRMQIVRQRIHLPPLTSTRYFYEDCSSSVTGLYWLAGLPDPNGLGYNGYGYTGTQANHGWVVWRLGQPISQLHPGDIVFYGGGWPHHHEGMYMGNGRVFTHGTGLGPLDLPIFYRPDAVGAHRYVTN